VQLHDANRSDHGTSRRVVLTTTLAACAALMINRPAEGEPLSDDEKARIDAVRVFAAGWKENNPEKVVAPFAEDCRVRWTAERLEAPPFIGKAEFLQNVQRSLANQTIEMKITDIFALGPLVVNCHHQLFDSKQNGPREDLYLGIYFFENGKIREWNDYAVFTPRPRTSHGRGFDRFSRVNPI
jgi:limonene-1,2-epoxide hydrolase